MGMRIEDISFVYERGTDMSVNALNHLSVEIGDGEFIGLVGHTGSGKSTFVQMLNGLLKPTEGKIYYNGEDIHGEGYDRKALRAHVGLVFQYPEHQLFETDVISDVCFGPKNFGKTPEESRKLAENALRMVGLPKALWTQSPFDLSGGQKRRAAIAGVLAMEPKIMILDEPTAGLDPQGRDEILGLVKQMQDEMGITIILVSHSMEDVANYAGRILVMDAGSIFLDGAPHEVFSHVEELEKMGLAAPQITYIMRCLADRGLPVSSNALTVEEALEEIVRALHV